MSDDPRVALMARIAGLEPKVAEAKQAAKEAASAANRIDCELRNAQNELYKLLGVEEPRRGIAVSR